MKAHDSRHKLMVARVLATRVSAIVTLALAPSAHAADGFTAGYEWAEYQSIDDPARCYEINGQAINNSAAFTQGCLQYLQDQGIIDENDQRRHHPDDPGSDQEDDG
jgi:hypothetical protein